MARSTSLTGLIARELWLFRYLLMLLFLVFISGFAVIYITYSTRLQITMKQKLSTQQDRLNLEYRHIQVEYNTLVEHSRIQYEAIHKLKMVFPTGKHERFIVIR